MLKTLALALAFVAGTAAAVSAHEFNPQPDSPGDDWADYAQIKIPDDLNFLEFGANAVSIDGRLLFLASKDFDDWENSL